MPARSRGKPPRYGVRRAGSRVLRRGLLLGSGLRCLGLARSLFVEHSLLIRLPLAFEPAPREERRVRPGELLDDVLARLRLVEPELELDVAQLGVEPDELRALRRGVDLSPELLLAGAQRPLDGPGGRGIPLLLDRRRLR